jgi:hypothetical protein
MMRRRWKQKECKKKGKEGISKMRNIIRRDGEDENKTREISRRIIRAFKREVENKRGETTKYQEEDMKRR